MKRVKQLLCCYPSKDDDSGRARERDDTPKDAPEDTNGAQLQNLSASPAVRRDTPRIASYDLGSSTTSPQASSTLPDSLLPSTTGANPTAVGSVVSPSNKIRGEKGSQGGKIAVAVVEKSLHAAKLVLDNFSVPGAGTAVEGILKVITVVKVSVFYFFQLLD